MVRDGTDCDAGALDDKDITMSFRISGLPAAPFAHLFALSDVQLAEHAAAREVAAGRYPCRISLTDAEPGDTLILVNYLHQPANSPYRSCHAIYVREGETTYDAIDEVPAQLRRRTLSVRGFDDAGMITEADLVEGPQLESLIERLFGNQRARYLHVHFAKPGCYAARVDRA
jgi:hypothetical protein